LKKILESLYNTILHISHREMIDYNKCHFVKTYQALIFAFNEVQYLNLYLYVYIYMCACIYIYMCANV